MKNAIILCAAIIGLLALPIAYSTVKGYTVWFWRNPRGQVFVNGQRVPGYVHWSKHVIIVTRADLAKRHSYWFRLNEQSTTISNYCGSWSAPDFFVFAVGDVNPPCFMIQEVAYDVEESPQPAVPILCDGARLGFTPMIANRSELSTKKLPTLVILSADRASATRSEDKSKDPCTFSWTRPLQGIPTTISILRAAIPNFDRRVGDVRIGFPDTRLALDFQSLRIESMNAAKTVLSEVSKGSDRCT